MAELHCRQTMDSLRAGKFSDLTLVCKDKTFPVQKALVCVLSSVLAESLYGSADKLSFTGTIDMKQFESDTVQAFVDFVYDGDYKILTSQSSQDGHEADILPEILGHVRVHHFASHYKVAKMAKISSNKLKSLLEENQGEELLVSSLPAAVEVAHELAISPEIMDMLAASAAKNVSQLQKKTSFAALASMPDFLLLVIQHCALNAETHMTTAKKGKGIQAKNEKVDEAVKGSGAPDTKQKLVPNGQEQVSDALESKQKQKLAANWPGQGSGALEPKQKLEPNGSGQGGSHKHSQTSLFSTALPTVYPFAKMSRMPLADNHNLSSDEKGESNKEKCSFWGN